MLLLVREPVHQLLLQFWQVQKEMIGLAHLQFAGLAAAQATFGVNKVNGIEGMTAIIALVAACCRVATVGTGSLDIAVGQKAAVCGAIGREHCIFEDIALLVEGQEEILRDAIVVRGARLRVEIPGYAQPVPYFADLLMIARDELAWCESLLL